jgi:hypothetical protein
MRRLAPLLALAAMLAAVLTFELAEPVMPAPASVRLAAHPRAAPAPAASIDEDALDDLVQTVLARPLPTPTRRGQDAPATEAEDGAEEDVPRLAGVLLGPSGHRAIFAPAKGRSLVLTEGDSLGQYTVTTIAPNTVTLSGSEGDRLISLSHAKTPPAGAAPRKGAGR